MSGILKENRTQLYALRFGHSIQLAVLALNGICISEHDGIIEKDIERTIIDIGHISSVGMQLRTR